MSVLITHAVMVDRVLMVSTVTPATVSQDLVETGVRQVCLLFVINNLYYLIDYFFDFFFDLKRSSFFPRNPKQDRMAQLSLGKETRM